MHVILYFLLYSSKSKTRHTSEADNELNVRLINYNDDRTQESRSHVSRSNKATRFESSFTNSGNKASIPTTPVGEAEMTFCHSTKATSCSGQSSSKDTDSLDSSELKVTAEADRSPYLSSIVQRHGVNDQSQKAASTSCTKIRREQSQTEAINSPSFDVTSEPVRVEIREEVATHDVQIPTFAIVSGHKQKRLFTSERPMDTYGIAISNPIYEDDDANLETVPTSEDANTLSRGPVLTKETKL